MAATMRPRNPIPRQTVATALLAVALALALLAMGAAELHAQSPPAAAPVAGSTAIQGTLVNGTKGGPTPAGATVLLHQFGVDSGAVETFETTADADGSFTFDAAPPIPDGGSAALVAIYGETRYSQVLTPADAAHPQTLTVYEYTRDVGVVTTARQSIIIAGADAADRRLAAMQLFTLENRSDTTLVPDLSAPPMIGQFSFLRFSLPADAANLDVATDLVGGEVIPVGTGFAITAPVPPGEHQVTFTFTAPYAGDTLAWRDNTLQGAESLRLMIPEELGRIGVSGLDARDLLDLGEVTYLVWGTEGLAPGAGVDLRLTGLPEPSWVTRVGNPLSEARFWYTALPVIVAAILGGLLVWGAWRRPTETTETAA